jgi:type II secretory pathway pseudopilin PulG
MIELIVVVVIVAIITTAALYSYATFRNTHVKDVSSGLVEQVFLQARNRVITLNRIQEIQVDLDRNLLWVDQLNPPEPPAVLLVRVPYAVAEVGMADFVDIVSIRVNGNPPQTTGIATVQLEPGAPGPLVLLELRREPDDATLDESYTTIRMEPGSLDVEVLKRTRIP